MSRAKSRGQSLKVPEPKIRHGHGYGGDGHRCTQSIWVFLGAINRWNVCSCGLVVQLYARAWSVVRRSVGKVLSLGFSNPGQGFLTLMGTSILLR